MSPRPPLTSRVPRILISLGLALFVGLAIGFAGVAAATPINPGVTYQVHDHPDGGLAPPDYALRLDGLSGDNSEDFTFSADTNGALLTLLYDDSAGTITISGTLYGGKVANNAWVDAQLWQVDFTYGAVTDFGDKIEATPGTGVGTITALGANGAGVGGFLLNQTIGLVDKANMAGLAFRLDKGHRVADPNTVTGHGWLTHDAAPRSSYQDWLFTVGAPIPEPNTALLIGAGLVVMAGTGRRTRE